MGDLTPKPSRITPSQTPEDPSMSGLHQFIHANQLPKDAPYTPHVHKLALQVAHNLRFQHGWTELRLHYHASRHAAAQSLPRPVISGLPPQRLYMHPDEQLEVLQKQRDQGKAGWPGLAAEREWVVPSQLRESWTLRRFADVFDALSTVPLEKEGGPLYFEAESWPWKGGANPLDRDDAERGLGTPGIPDPVDPLKDANTPNGEGTLAHGQTAAASHPWRTGQPKRILLATLDDDSTVVYYIMHDGIVKPRQN